MGLYFLLFYRRSGIASVCYSCCLLWHGWLVVLLGEETVSNSESLHEGLPLTVPSGLIGLCCLVRKPSLTWNLTHQRLPLITRTNNIPCRTWSAACQSPSNSLPLAFADWLRWERRGPASSLSLPKALECMTPNVVPTRPIPHQVGNSAKNKS